MLGGNEQGGTAGTAEDYFRGLSPVDQLKAKRELANKRKYSPMEASANLQKTLTDLAYSTPVVANAMSIRDAFEAKERAGQTSDPIGKKQAEAESAAAALSAFLPFGIGKPAAGSASRFGVFVPVKEGKTAERAKSMFDELADEIGPDAANKAVHDETGTVFGAGGDLYDPVSDVSSQVKRSFQGGDVAPLSDVLEHPELFAKTPYMRDVPVNFTSEKTLSDVPIARTLPEGGYKITEGLNPKQMKERLSKLNQYTVSEKENFPAAARHVESQQLQELDDTIARTHELKDAGLLFDDDATDAYLAQLTKQRADMEKLLRGETEGVELVTTGNRWKNKDLKSPLRNQLLHRSAGTIDAMANKARVHNDTGYPFRQSLPMNERLVLPQSKAAEDFSAMLKRWRQFGAGRGRSNMK